MYRVLIADDEELELKAMHFFMERNYPEAMLLPDREQMAACPFRFSRLLD